jgi:predicted HTH domain antitoxin
MSELVSFRLPTDLQRELEIISREEDKDKSEIVRELIRLGIKERKIEKAITLYKEGKVSASKAAEIADVSLWKMIEIFAERKIEAQYGLKELAEDIKASR